MTDDQMTQTPPLAVDKVRALVREKTPAEQLVGPIREAIEADFLVDVADQLAALHPADFADLIEYLDKDDRRALVDQLGKICWV